MVAPTASWTITNCFHQDVPNARKQSWTNALLLWIRRTIRTVSIARIVTASSATTDFTKRIRKHTARTAFLTSLHQNAVVARNRLPKTTSLRWTSSGIQLASCVQNVVNPFQLVSVTFKSKSPRSTLKGIKLHSFIQCWSPFTLEIQKLLSVNFQLCY